MFTTIISIFGTAMLAVLGWLFQSEKDIQSRVSVLESKHEDLMTLISTRFDDLNRRLERIERAMNGFLIGRN